MSAIISLVIGYLLGSISPASLVGKRNNVDLKQEGTKNLGATNTMMVLGWPAGIFVMVFDIAKSFLSGKLAQFLFPQLQIAGMLACIGAMLGHCFPLFLHFHGGKGLSAFGGLIIYYNIWFVPIILFSALALMVLLDCGVAFPLLVSVLFPLLVYAFGATTPEILTAILASVILFLVHLDNLKKAFAKDESMRVRKPLKEKLFRKK